MHSMLRNVVLQNATDCKRSHPGCSIGQNNIQFYVLGVKNNTGSDRGTDRMFFSLQESFKSPSAKRKLIQHIKDKLQKQVTQSDPHTEGESQQTGKKKGSKVKRSHSWKQSRRRSVGSDVEESDSGSQGNGADPGIGTAEARAVDSYSPRVGGTSVARSQDALADSKTDKSAASLFKKLQKKIVNHKS